MPEKNNKILIIEDDTFIIRAYKDGFEKEGLEVITATDGQEGLDKIRSESPDLVLLDLILPVKNGFEVLEELKVEKINIVPPTVILTNLGQESDVKKGKSYGAIDYLVKANYSMSEVINRVKQHLKDLNK